MERTDTELPADVAALMRERGVPPAIASGNYRYVLTERTAGEPRSRGHPGPGNQSLLQGTGF